MVRRKRTRFGGMWRRACLGRAKPETHCDTLQMADRHSQRMQSDAQAHQVVGDGTFGRLCEISGESCPGG